MITIANILITTTIVSTITEYQLMVHFNEVHEMGLINKLVEPELAKGKNY